jgi:dihydroneopterin aldolase
MDGEMTIELKQLRFFSYHGLYLEEKKNGGEYEVNMTLSFYPPGKIKSLKETINYESLFKFLKDEMDQPRELLETLTMEIAEKIHERFPDVKKVRVEIIKLNPPIENFTGSASAAYSKEF